jgi:hypothetical protein
MPGENYLIKIQLDIQNDAALQAMVARLEAAARQAPQTASAMKKAGAEIDNFGRGAKRMGNIAQNTGYQVQDLIVQIQGGTDPMRALSQQLPQLAVGFGAWGAAIGIVGAALPLLIKLVMDTEEAAVSLEDALSELSGAMTSIGDVADAANMDRWSEEFNKVGQAAQQAMLNTLEYETVLLRIASGKTASALKGFDSPSSKSFGFAEVKVGKAAEVQAKALALAQAEYAANIGLTVEQVDSLNASLEKIKQSSGLDMESTTQALEILRQSGVTTGEVSTQTLELRAGLLELAKAQDTMRVATEKSAEAAAGYGVVLAEVTGGGESRGGGGGGGRSSGGRSGGGAPKDRTAEINRERLAAADALIKSGDRYLASLQETYDKEREIMGERLQLWREFNPELATYADTVNTANEALKAEIITEERFIAIRDQAQVKMEEGLAGWSLQTEALNVFKESFNTMLDGVLMGTQDIGEGFKDMAKVVIAQILKMMAYQAIASAFGGPGGSVMNKIGNSFANGGKGLANANGNAFMNGNVVPFARGGIVNGPTIFPMAKGMGLMGEAGPEAVMPLARGRDGKLGVSGGGMNVTVNNMASGVEVKPRQTDQGLTIDVVMRQVSQAIQRGGNEVSDSMERAYSLGRGRGVY